MPNLLKLKQFLFSKNLPEQDKEKIEQANQGLWSILFSYSQGEDWYNELKKLDITPTKEELAECCDEGVNAWHRLTQFPDIFKELVENDILPDSADLKIIDPKTNTNVWYLLTSTYSHLTLFNTLAIEKNIIPDTADLSLCNLEDNTNTWYRLSDSSFGMMIFYNLLVKDVTPNASDLRILTKHKSPNAWHALANQIDIFQKNIFPTLIEKNIFPRSEDLSLCSLDNTNGWSLLAIYNCASFSLLVKKGITPQAKDLSNLTNGKNGWYWLTYDYNLFLTLLEKGIFPQAKDLNVSLLKGEHNGWCTLAKFNSTALFELLNKGILPEAKYLSRSKVGEPYGWFLLAENNPSYVLKLFGLDIFPQAKDLNDIALDNKGRWTSIWNCLADKKDRLPIFKWLLKKGILPQERWLNHTDSAIWDNTVWENLAENSAHDVLSQLYKLGFIPDNAIPIPNTRNPELESIIYRLNHCHQSLDELSVNFKVDKSNLAVRLVANENTSYAFLYLMMMLIKNENMSILSIEIWAMIGEYLLPQGFSWKLPELLNEDSNRDVLIKNHVVQSLRKYDHKDEEGNSDKGLKKAINNSNLPITQFLSQQYMTFYKKSCPKNEMPSKNPLYEELEKKISEEKDDDQRVHLEMWLLTSKNLDQAGEKYEKEHNDSILAILKEGVRLRK